MNNFIFLTGAARGGTTWFRKIISKLNNNFIEIPFQVELHKFKKLNEEIIYREIEKIYNQKKIGFSINQIKNKTIILKSPMFCHCLYKLSGIENSKILAIVRDPRDVCVSYKKTDRPWTKDLSKIDLCSNRTAIFYKKIISFNKKKIKIIKFEHLHQNFHKTVIDIANYLDINFNKCDDLYNLINSHNIKTGISSIKSSNLRNGTIFNWQNDLSASDLNFVNKNYFYLKFLKDFQYSNDFFTIKKLLNQIFKNYKLHIGSKIEFALLSKKKEFSSLELKKYLEIRMAQYKKIFKRNNVSYYTNVKNLNKKKYKNIIKIENSIISITKRLKYASKFVNNKYHINTEIKNLFIINVDECNIDMNLCFSSPKIKKISLFEKIKNFVF